MGGCSESGCTDLPGARPGSPESFSLGVDALGSNATRDDHIPGKRGEQR
jgi:hypothetical protein